jgi:hypothetical protein
MREVEERKKEAVAVKKKNEAFYPTPSMVYIGWFYHPKYPDK